MSNEGLKVSFGGGGSDGTSWIFDDRGGGYTKRSKKAVAENNFAVMSVKAEAMGVATAEAAGLGTAERAKVVIVEVTRAVTAEVPGVLIVKGAEGMNAFSGGRANGGMGEVCYDRGARSGNDCVESGIDDGGEG